MASRRPKTRLLIAAGFLAGATQLCADWPSYLGGNGAFSETSGVKLVSDMTQVRLLWQSQEKGIGFGKGGSQAFRNGFAPGTGLAYGGEASPIVAGGLVLQFYTTPSGEQSWKDGPANLGAKFKEFASFYQIGADETLIAIDAATGRTKWKRTFAGQGLNMVPAKRGGFATTPCAANGKVYAMGTTGRLYALELATGAVAWQSHVGPVHLALEAFKAESLKTLVRTNPPCGRPYGMLAVAQGVLLAPDWSGGLVGVDTATGQRLWQSANLLSGFNGPVVTRHGIACVNAAGELRLVNPKTGAVLWTQALGSVHLTQPVFGGDCLLVFEAHPRLGRKYGLLAAYRVTPTAAAKVWQLPAEYFQHLGLDDGPARKIVARQGLVYASLRRAEGTGLDPNDATPLLVIARETDGQILGAHEVDGWNPYLWGDRLITVTDIQHRPRGVRPEVWQMYEADPARFRPLGDGWLVDGPPPVHDGTCGYELPILEAFADGVFFCRVWGGIRAYDLRAATFQPALSSAPALDPQTATWELTLKNFFTKHRPLQMILHRKDGQWSGYRVTGTAYNIAWHQAELSQLRFQEGRLTGPVTIKVMPDRWVPADRSTNVVEVTLDLTLTGRTVTGAYTGTAGGTGTNVVGRIRPLVQSND